MAIINLKRYYYPLITKDTYMEVPDDVAQAFAETEREGRREDHRKWYYGTLSLDQSVGLENHAMFFGLSPEELMVKDENNAAYLKGKGIPHLDCLYGVSMGGATVIRFLATQDITADKAIIDAGITPYTYPKWICRLIALKDWAMIMLGTKSYSFMKLAMPPERWTPKGEDPETHYRKIFEFEKNHFSSKTIYNVFWSANNYSMPKPVPYVDTAIEYWYGEEEKKARKNNLAYTIKAFPQTVPKEFKGLAHAELVLMFPERFRDEVIRFLDKK